MSFAQLDGESDVDVNGQEKEEGAHELGQPVGPEGAPGAGALVGAADAVDDSRRGYLRVSSSPATHREALPGGEGQIRRRWRL